MIAAQLAVACVHGDNDIELVVQRAVVQNEKRLRVLNAKWPERRRQRDGRRAGVDGVAGIGQRLARREPLRVVDAVEARRAYLLKNVTQQHFGISPWLKR
jgi:hypothetical protein